jgi:hypothetical protein
MDMAEKVLSIPMSPYLSQADVAHVADVLIKATTQTPSSKMDAVELSK